MTDEIWTVGRILQWTEQYFREKGIPSARLDGEVLLSHILKKERIYCYSHYDQPLTPEELKAFKDIIKKRVEGHAVAVLTGYKEFMGLRFAVNEHVLIPRPDTETLVEGVLQLMPRQEEFRILDVCLGSGAILHSVLHYAPKALGIGVDLSPEALAIAKENATKLGVEDRAYLFQSDLFSAIPTKKADGSDNLFDIITSNPPYIPTKDIEELAIEVKNEPHMALDGGVTGLDFYGPLVQQGAMFLKEGGYLVLEIGQGQEEDVLAMAKADGSYDEMTTWKDLSGIVRDVVLRKKIGG